MKNISTKQKQTQRHREQTRGCQGGGGGRGGGLGVWDYRCKLSDIRWIKKKVLLYSTGNSISCDKP